MKEVKVGLMGARADQPQDNTIRVAGPIATIAFIGWQAFAAPPPVAPVPPVNSLVYNVGGTTSSSGTFPMHMPVDHIQQVQQKLQASIDRARPMLDWPEDWDDDGAPPVSREAWDRAVNLLSKAVEAMAPEYLRTAFMPVIGPGPDGSIDLHWKQNRHGLLLNIPTEAGKQATFYGDTDDGEVVSGELDPNTEQEWLFAWLKKLAPPQ